jgi:hypothetical protein
MQSIKNYEASSSTALLDQEFNSVDEDVAVVVVV